MEPSGPVQTEVKTTPSKPSAWGQPNTSPWGTPSTPAPRSLEDVMSEELANQLREEDNKTNNGDDGGGIPVNVDFIQASQSAEGCDNDLLLAQMLQHEFDREHDKILRREEAKLNNQSKVTMSFKHYRNVHPALQDDVESEEDIDDIYVDRHTTEVKVPKFSKGGVSGKGSNMVTKHDATISARRNTTLAMDKFGPSFGIGDARSIDMQLPNKVFNKLKQTAASMDKRGHKIHEKKDHATTEQAIDPKTKLILFKLVNGGTLDNVNGVISAGKEAVVYHADGGNMDGSLVPDECAIKIFKTTLCDFKNRAIYVKGDVRFFKDEFKKQNPRRIMKIWAAKEEFNLKCLERARVPCPRVVLLKKHVLVMAFIGKDRKAAPKLKDAILSTADIMDAYDQCISNMKRMYNVAGLIHADLSEYNMLWQDGILYFIDVGQAVEKMHPRGFEFLLRDCSNICSYFTKKGVPDVPTPHQLFNDITGLNFEGDGAIFLTNIEEYEKNEEKLRMEKGKDYAFEHFFEKAQKERQARAEEDSEEYDTQSEDSEDEEDCGVGEKEVDGKSETKASSCDQPAVKSKTY